jgi:hypothetical protein
VALVDSGYYESQRRGIEQGYAANMASNAFARTQSQTRGNRGLNMMRQEFGRATPKFTAGFAQRGFGSGIQSGVMQQSMQNFVGDYTQQYGAAQQDMTDQLRQYDLEAAQYGSQRTNSIADLELAKARDIAFAAQNIEALRAAFGGT